MRRWGAYICAIWCPSVMVKRDRFELISAYLDGEVTAAERKQVEEWLVNADSMTSTIVLILYINLLEKKIIYGEPSDDSSKMRVDIGLACAAALTGLSQYSTHCLSR